jgi:hypothetical protein
MRGQPLRCLAQLRLAKKTIEYKQVCTGCPTVAVRRAARVPSPQAWGSSVRSRIETNLAGPGRNCNLHLPEPLYLQDWVFTVSGGWIPGNAYSFFFLSRPKMSWRAHRMVLETTSRNQGSGLSSATMIPQMTVVADLTRSERIS